MNAQDLKNSILQLAVQGKLVEQRPEEGTAKELLAQIKAEKEQLIKDKKIKKEKPLPEITEDEIPYDIPESWEWVRLNDLVSKDIKRGKSPTYIEASNIQVFAQKCNVKTGSIDMTLAMYLDESKLSKYPHEEFLRDKDIVINSTGTGTMGRVGMFSDADRIRGMRVVPDSHVTVVRVGSCIEASYIFHILKYYQKYMESMGEGSTNQKELKPWTIMNLVLPLPPVEEQKRIVTKIEEILPYIEQYDKAHTKQEALNKKFPEDMQKSILQLAMQGKLVEQRPEEGTADELYEQIVAEKARLIKAGKIKKTKSLPSITEELLPCKIPSNWKACYIDDVAFVTKLAGFEYTKNIADYITTIGVPLIKGKNVQNGRILMEFESYIPEKVSDDLPRSQINKKCLLTPYVGTIGNIAIFDGDFKAHLGSNVGKIELLNGDETFILEEYVLYYLRSVWGYKELTKYKKSTAQESISIDAIRNVILLLPPLGEQKRIVDKLDQMLLYCDQLIKGR